MVKRYGWPKNRVDTQRAWDELDRSSPGAWNQPDDVVAVQERRSAAAYSAGDPGVVVLEENGRSFGRAGRERAGWSAWKKKGIREEGLKGRVRAAPKSRTFFLADM